MVIKTNCKTNCKKIIQEESEENSSEILNNEGDMLIPEEEKLSHKEILINLCKENKYKFIEDMCKKHHKSLNTHEVKKDNDKIYCFFCNKNITRQQLFIHKRTKKHTRNHSQFIGEIFNII